MSAPRFRIRSLVVLILVVGLVLAVAMLSIQNHRLRTEIEAQQVRARFEYDRYLTAITKAQLQPAAAKPAATQVPVK
jgi:hypothetical protein